MTPDVSEPSPAADPLDLAWRRLDATWDDPEAHRAFLGLAATLGRLPEAGRLYREVREAGGDRRERADKQLGAVALLAFEALAATRPQGRPKHLRVLKALGVVVALAFVGVALTVLRAVTTP